MAYKSMLAGHSAGAWWHQQEPVISRDNPRRLKQRMVIAMEPHVDHWHIQDMFVVGADGPQLISSKFPTNEIFFVPVRPPVAGEQDELKAGAARAAVRLDRGDHRLDVRPFGQFGLASIHSLKRKSTSVVFRLRIGRLIAACWGMARA